MPARLRHVLEDLRRGRNADAYVAVAAALVVGLLGLMGVLSLRWTAPVLLLCMVPLINLTLATYERSGAAAGQTPVPMVEFPTADLARDWSRNGALLLVGVSLVRTVRTHEGDIARRLSSGSRVRVLVVDPDDLVAMELTDRRREYGVADASRNRSEVGITLGALDQLASANPTWRLEIRVLDFPIGLSGVAFEPGDAKARLYVETYPFKTPETQPHFVLERTHAHWFDHFSRELENMWSAGHVRGHTTAP